MNRNKNITSNNLIDRITITCFLATNRINNKIVREKDTHDIFLLKLYVGVSFLVRKIYTYKKIIHKINKSKSRKKNTLL
ncbi:MAG: hypothetical protein ACYDAS_01675 [Patescibacteria group bacterium]